MNRLSLAVAAALAFASGAGTSPAYAAAHASALQAVASSLGYSYSYLGPEDAVSLSRPGVTIVIRPGELLYDVNDRTEAMDGQAPYFSKSDIFVSDGFVARLRAIAARYPNESASSAAERAERLENSAGNPAAVSGAITDLQTVQLPGSSSVSVDGKAPANLPITLTLVGSMSKDIPDVVLSRHRVVSNADGRFTTSVSVAPGYFAGTVYTLVASSLPGIAPATARLSLKAPNAQLSVPADTPQ